MSTTPVISDKYIAPLQPDLSRQLRYNERLLTWNPYSKKNLALCYQFQTSEDGAPVRLIPDACIDFLFRCTPGSPAAVVSGLQTAPRELVLEPNAVYFGFKPFSPKGMRPLRTDWQDLVDQSISLWEDCPDAGWVTEMLSASSTFDERVGIVAEFARRQLADPEYTPDFVEYSELQLCQARGNIRMDSISDYTGYTGRYCREKFKESHGISIKNYSSIMRFQNAVRMLARSGGEVGSLSDIAFDNGYFDQSHLNREFRRFSGATPLRYQREVLQLT